MEKLELDFEHGRGSQTVHVASLLMVCLTLCHLE
jgi:hypothetical protein